MPKTLERDLGLYATTTISIGAMIGSGIFVLPGLASKIAGPAVIAAYFLAGLIVIPSALAKAEIATAMPEAGGTYLYIDRAMGPLLGTIAGVGAWFSLVFKSAFALVGLGAYLLLFVSVPPDSIVFVALGLAVFLLAVNVIGVKQTGRLQATIVTLVLLALVVFIGDGLTHVNESQFHPFFKHGSAGVLTATGFVFVSYAGVTKIASVAEEIENPGRNIPIGILGSVCLMMLVYTFVVFVMVGVVPADELAHTLTPMALAAGEVIGPMGKTVLSIIAVMALMSMANAGILSSTRFPLAMSRDDLAPPRLAEISERFQTPVYSIVFTGAILLVLIAFVPVVDLAKLASAFKIILFTIVNLALVAFRESNLESYDPEFVAPGYPWVQLFGIGGGVVLLTQMGLLPMIGAVGLIVGGVAWYQVYGRDRTEREGAALDALRATTEEYSVQATEQLFATGGGGGLMVATSTETDRQSEAMLLDIAQALVGRRGGRLAVVRFSEVPDQVSLARAAEEHTEADELFEQETADLTTEFNTPVEIDEVVSHDIEHAVANYVREHQINLVIGEREPELFHGELFGEDVDWFMNNVPADLIFARNRDGAAVDEITVIGDRGPYSPLEVLVADALGNANDATVRFVQAVAEGITDEQLAGIKTYHENLQTICTANAEYELIQTDDREKDLLTAAEGTDIAITSTSAHHILYDVLFGTLPDRLVSELDSTVLLVHTDEPRRHTFLRYLIERVAF
ncbi:MAG: APC family permease [Halolamina sp.]